MNAPDDQISIALSELADEAAPPRIMIDAAWRAGRRRRWAAIGGAAVAMATALATVVAVSPLLSSRVPAARSGGRTVSPLRPDSVAARSARWTSLPKAPIAARSEYTAVWTGKDMIVWGGYSNSNTQYGDGASYDPATRTWTKLAAGPLSARIFPVSVWTGKEMLIFGGAGNRMYSDGAAYDPATSTWRKLAPVPHSLGGNLTGSGSYAVWTGKLMVAWGFFGRGGGEHGGGSLAAATYNPVSNSWTTGAAAPAQAPLFGDAFWTGKEMIVWGSSATTGSSGGHLVGYAYDPVAKKWSTLPASPLGRAGRGSMLAAWTGQYLVVGGGYGSSGLEKDAAAYDPATNRWTRMPNAPVGFEGNGTAPDVWTGSSVITIEDAVAGGRPLSLDLATRSWSVGAKAPVPGRQEADELWTGSKVLVWGGGVPVGNSCCKTVTRGYSYTP